eukprot:TRINITY_DN2612_c0_g1_i8.p1 TRINITY_DN2612_c0_g1~~TRINITY_DN2612_c0_g1_i8.p1  ORF type:complete len:184 (-),score=29.82 TRINITY_DN2612_c0_g1_i8:141-692(-)
MIRLVFLLFVGFCVTSRIPTSWSADVVLTEHDQLQFQGKMYQDATKLLQRFDLTEVRTGVVVELLNRFDLSTSFSIHKYDCITQPIGNQFPDLFNPWLAHAKPLGKTKIAKEVCDQYIFQDKELALYACISEGSGSGGPLPYSVPVMLEIIEGGKSKNFYFLSFTSGVQPENLFQIPPICHLH